MSQLPGRPDADQLRRQARELHRAAVGGDAGALGQLREVSGKVTLSAAQLAIARDYGFPSWPRLKAEVERRRAGTGWTGQAGPAAEAPPPPVRSWAEMRDWAARLLLSRTGEDVQAWNRRVADAGPADEPALRSWLTEQGITGYSQALLVWERFGYPDFLTAGAPTASTSPGRSSAGLATTAASAWPGARYPATERCGCSAGPSSGSWTWIPR